MKAVTEATREGKVKYHIGFVFGADVQIEGDKPLIQLFHIRKKGGRSDTVEAFPVKFRRVVIATGFQRYSFEHWFHGGEFFGPRKFEDVSKKVQKRDKLEKRKFDTWKENWIACKIMEDLSYRNCEMRWPSAMLYLPTLAGFSCGPGFPTPGCLGRMSDQIISSHLLFVANSQEKI